jgi:WD40 repeat protein
MNLTKHWAAVLDDYAIDLAWSPDGTLLAAASAAGPVSLFALASGVKQHELPGHDGGTNVLAWKPAHQRSDARGQRAERDDPLPTSDLRPLTSDLRPLTSDLLLATGGQDGAVKFWDAGAGQHTATARLGGAWVEHLVWRPAASSDPGRQRPEVSAQQSSSSISPLGTPPTQPPLPATGLRPPGAGLLFAAAGRTLTALRPDGSTAHTFKPAPKTICAVAVEPAGGAIAAAYFGGVCLWDADDFIVQKEFPYANGIQTLVWSPDGRWLVSGNQDPSVHLWIPAEGIELHMSGYEGKVKVLSFDRTSRWLATSGGRDACIWDCAGAGPEGREPMMLPHDAPVCAVAYQRAGGLLATAAQDGTLQLWSPDRPQPLRATVRMPSAATRLAWSPDDRYLAIGSEKGAVYVLQCEV